jgi:hypothetical protein
MLEPKRCVAKLFVPIILSAMSIVSPLYVAVDEFPKSGEAEFTTYATIRTLATIDSGAGAGGVADYAGVMQNDKGNGPFNNMVVECLQNRTMLEAKVHVTGSCVLTDPEGDNIFDEFEGANFKFVSGTGKYKGINGNGTVAGAPLHSLAGGARAFVGHHKVTWEIK